MFLLGLLTRVHDVNERPKSDRSATSAAPTRTAPPDAATIFIVDGDEAVRDALATSLEGAGFSVALSGSAQAFLDAYRPEGRACLLVELDLPDFDGGALVSMLLARRIELPAIVMSRRLKNHRLAARLPAGVAGVLEKPFGDAELLGQIRHALGGVPDHGETPSATDRPLISDSP